MKVLSWWRKRASTAECPPDKESQHGHGSQTQQHYTGAWDDMTVGYVNAHFDTYKVKPYTVKGCCYHRFPISMVSLSANILQQYILY